MPEVNEEARGKPKISRRGRYLIEIADVPDFSGTTRNITVKPIDLSNHDMVDTGKENFNKHT